MRALLLAVVLLSACDRASEQPPPAPRPKKPSVDAAAPPAKTPSPEAEMTGNPVCDELLARVRCNYQKGPVYVSPETLQALDESVKAWKAALADDATRQGTIDACQQSLDAAKDAFAAQGC